MAVTLPELAESSRVVLDAADGVAIVVLGDPRGALRLAERALRGRRRPAARLGLKHGAVRPTGSGSGRGPGGRRHRGRCERRRVRRAAKLLVSRAFRDALADAAPGAEAAASTAGTHTDASLRAHELFKPDPRAARRRGQPLRRGDGAAVCALLGAGVAYRASIEGPQVYADRMAAA